MLGVQVPWLTCLPLLPGGCGCGCAQEDADQLLAQVEELSAELSTARAALHATKSSSATASDTLQLAQVGG